jgi:hypothetical protein
MAESALFVHTVLRLQCGCIERDDNDAMNGRTRPFRV